LAGTQQGPSGTGTVELDSPALPPVIPTASPDTDFPDLLNLGTSGGTVNDPALSTNVSGADAGNAVAPDALFGSWADRMLPQLT
jgi:hypothetical protein